VEVFGVVDVPVGASLDTMDDTGLEVEKDGAGDVPSVVGLCEVEERRLTFVAGVLRGWETDLVEEYILSITAFGRKIF